MVNYVFIQLALEDFTYLEDFWLITWSIFISGVELRPFDQAKISAMP
jgi:hypothetical protein